MRTSFSCVSLLFLLISFFLSLSSRASDNFFVNDASSGENAAKFHDYSFESVYCPTPTGLYTSDITETSAILNWSAVSGAENYSVQTRLPGGTWYSVPGSPFPYTSVIVDGLNPGTTYEWRVRANCSYGDYSYWSYPVSFTTEGSSYCEAPDWLETTNITQTTATFDWSPANGAVSYSIQWRYPGGSWYNLPGNWTYTYVNVGGLQPDTDYEWRVRSNCSNGMVSAWSYPEGFTTLPASCNIPTGLYTSNITESTATLHWSTVSGAESYSVQIRQPGGSWSYVPGSPFSYTSITVYGLSPGTTYEWRVRANCGYGDYSYWTSPVSFTTEGSYTCETPDWLYTTNITQTTATLDWSPAYGAINYSIQWRYAGGTWNYLPGTFTYTYVTIGGLQPDTDYEWRVRSNCANGMVSAWSYPEAFTTLGSSCETPTGLYTTNITETTATFNWSPVPGAQSYSVQKRLPNGTWSYVQGSPFSNTYVTVYGLTPGTTYEWRVRANCSYGNYSYWSYPVSFTTEGSSECTAPEWLNTANITQTTAIWDWSPVSGAVSYSIQWRYAGGSWYNLPGTWTYTQITVGGLQPGTSYEWRVRSNCAYGMYSPWSVPGAFTTLPSNCYTPAGLYTTNITSTSATFNWSPVSGAQNYSVQRRLPNGTWYYVQGSPFYNTSVTVYGLNPGTTYEWRVRANCGYGNSSAWSYPVSFTTEGSSACFAPDGLYTTNITQTTATFDWTSVSGAVSYSIQWRYAGGTWYDLPGGPWNNTWLTVSGLQPSTDYEWRVKSNCSNGEMSPWSVPESFTTLGSYCNTPTGLYTSNITNSSATFNWSSVSGAQNYSVQTRLPNGSWTYVPGSPFTNTSVTVNGFNPNTTYEWRVRTNCSYYEQSNWSPAISFTTSGSGNAGNDYCGNAVQLYVGYSCSYTSGSNINATASLPAPSGGCPTAGYKDVWFKFTMPDGMDPQVTIRTTSGSLSDAIMEVYMGNSCAELTMLTCEDDNDNGNGSPMPVINLSGNPSATIYVRVWGYGGMTGTFNICVFDYESNNFSDLESFDITPADAVVEELIEISEPASEDVITSPSIRLAPNPANDILFVTVARTKSSTVTGIVLMDVSGKIILRKDYQSNDPIAFQDQLDVSALVPGMYVIQIMTTDGMISEKVIVTDH